MALDNADEEATEKPSMIVCWSLKRLLDDRSAAASTSLSQLYKFPLNNDSFPDFKLDDNETKRSAL